MALQIGDDSSQGWTTVKDLRAGGIYVQVVMVPEGNSWVELWRRTPYVMEISSNIILRAPSWALYADVVIIGGGGGGAGGDGAVANNGRGGNSALYKSATRNVHPGDELDFTIGLGGSGGRSEKASGSRGGTTEFVHKNYLLEATGGAGGTGTGTSADAKGVDSGRYTRDGWEIMGASGGTLNNPGQAPGAGGGGGSGGIFGKWSPGQPGGKGGAWVRFRSA